MNNTAKPHTETTGEAWAKAQLPDTLTTKENEAVMKSNKKAVIEQSRTVSKPVTQQETQMLADERENHRLNLLIPTVSNADLHKLIPVHTCKVDPKTIRPEVVVTNLEEVAAPYLTAFHCHENTLQSISCNEAIKLVAKYTPTQRAMIYAGFLLSVQETSFPLLPVDELYEVNVSLKEHVKAIAELAAEAPILVQLDLDEILRQVIYVA